MVQAVRAGASMRSVAAQFGVRLLTVQRWVARAAGQRLDRVDWQDRPSVPHHVHRTAAAMEALVLGVRRALKETSDLGEYGAVAIHRELDRQGVSAPPAARTIQRILERHGALDQRHRVRHRPPPPGWYLPDLGAHQVELDSFDVVEGLAIQGGPVVDVLTGLSLHGGLPTAWPAPEISAEFAVTSLIEHWCAFGLPAYAQFDNDTRFQGPHQHPDVIGRVMRLCLSLGVVPVFAPPRETGFQAAIERFNGRWQAKVWSRFTYDSLAALCAQSARFLAAARQRTAARMEGAPARRPFPPRFRLDLQAQPRGRMVYLRRTDDDGAVSVLGHSVVADPHWRHRLVRVEIDLDADVMRFHALRRRQPDQHRFLRAVEYILPPRRFRD